MSRRTRRTDDLSSHSWVCSSCGRSTPFDQAGSWNCEMRAGIIVAVLCDRCQTPEQNAEAVVNEATLEYAVDSFGRVTATPKGVTS